MKSARELARAAFKTAYDPNLTNAAIIADLELMFEEHARDQRQIVAELQLANDALPVARTDAARIASNAPAPGE